MIRFCGQEADLRAIAALPYDHVAHGSLSAPGTNLKRRLNRYLGRVERMNPEPWFALTRKKHRRLIEKIEFMEAVLPHRMLRRAESRMRATIDEWAGDRFKESNARLNAWMEDDLGAYGYSL